MTTSLHDFRRASHGHSSCANHLVDGPEVETSGTPPAKISSTAAYLASVSLECSIKARILYRGGFESVDDLQLKHPAIYRSLFISKHGHDLQKLADGLRLPQFVALEGKKWNDDGVWKRMASCGRPYSLRYGTEELTPDEAKAEVQRANELSEMLLSGLSTPRKKRRRRK